MLTNNFRDQRVDTLPKTAAVVQFFATYNELARTARETLSSIYVLFMCLPQVRAFPISPRKELPSVDFLSPIEISHLINCVALSQVG